MLICAYLAKAALGRAFEDYWRPDFGAGVAKPTLFNALTRGRTMLKCKKAAHIEQFAGNQNL
jgi:hypothetical protein